MEDPKNELGFKWEKPSRLKRVARKVIKFFSNSEPYEPLLPDRDLDKPPSDVVAASDDWHIPEEWLESKERKEE